MIRSGSESNCEKATRNPRRVRGEGEDPLRRWFFDPFVPDNVSIPDAARQGATHNVAWERVSTDLLARHAQFWELSPGAAWHGFAQTKTGFAITDPAKLTLLTPGFDRNTGAYEPHGVPRAGS